MYNLIVTHGQNHGLPQALYDHYAKLGTKVILLQLPYRPDMKPPFIKCNFMEIFKSGSTVCLNGKLRAIRLIFQSVFLIVSLLRIYNKVGYPDKIFASNPLNFFCVYLFTPREIPFSYVTIDFSLRAFGPLSKIYTALDKFSCIKSSRIIGVSNVMNSTRSKFYKISKDKFGIIPIGLINFCPPLNLNRKRSQRNFIYLGSVEAKYRIDFIIDCLEEISDQNWTLDIVGDGSALKTLKAQVANNNCNNRINFHGNITNREIIIPLVNRSLIGLCLIDPKLDNFSRFADITKVKEYIGYGIPVICSNNLKSRYDSEKPIIYTDFNKNNLKDIFVNLLKKNNEALIDLERKVKKSQQLLLWENILKNSDDV